jgi:two-component system response regulator FlrC
MPENNNNHILWTATHTSLPRAVWNRIEELGYKVLLIEEDNDTSNRIKKVSPRMWVGQINGNPDDDLSLLSEIRQAYPDMPIIMSSKNPSIDEAVKAIKLGATDYLHPGISHEQLQLIIEGALQNPLMPLPNHRPGRRTPAPATSFPIAVSRSMKGILSLSKRIAHARSTVLIQGESGTGKEVVARHIHSRSDRKNDPFVAVNCAALPENLLESELFGHEKGAFTGAVSRKKGKFELAHGGSILLDEISEMPPSLQAKLLRVLQEREIDRVGGQTPISVDVRVIATTNRDLGEEIRKGNFRSDLYYRLNVVPIVIPPLRQRSEDIIPLAGFFLQKHAAANKMKPKTLSSDAGTRLKQENWPGNVRELENLMERALLLIDTDPIRDQDLGFITQINGAQVETGSHATDPGETFKLMPLKEMEKKLIYKALDNHRGNRTHASKVLGISVRTLRNKLNEYQKEVQDT